MFALFNCLLDPSCGECNVICVCCVYGSVCELFDEIIRNMFGCGCYFVVEYYGVV